MTATSMPSPTAVTTSWKAALRVAAAAIAIVALAVIAFSVGRHSVTVHPTAPVIAPAAASVPSQIVDDCRLRRQFC